LLPVLCALLDLYAPRTIEKFAEIAKFLDKHLGKLGFSQEEYDGGRSTPRGVP
jgi:hypothetical protein